MRRKIASLIAGCLVVSGVVFYIRHILSANPTVKKITYKTVDKIDGMIVEEKHSAYEYTLHRDRARTNPEI
jgi:hypothetical protein